MKDEIAAPRSLLPWIVLVSAAIQLLNEPASAAASRIVRWAASPRTQSQVTPAHTGLTQGRYVDLGFRGERTPATSSNSFGCFFGAVETRTSSAVLIWHDDNDIVRASDAADAWADG